MARGIGGDDGPSLWMFAACILIWYKLSDLAGKAKDKIEDELNTNHASVLQPETTSDIARLEKKVKAITYKLSNLRLPVGSYTSIAQKLWQELSADFWTSESAMFDMLTPLNADELKCVAKEFGVKEDTLAGIVTLHTVDLFAAFDLVLSDGVFSKDLTKMHAIWKKTKLW